MDAASWLSALIFWMIAAFALCAAIHHSGYQRWRDAAFFVSFMVLGFGKLNEEQWGWAVTLGIALMIITLALEKIGYSLRRFFEKNGIDLLTS